MVSRHSCKRFAQENMWRKIACCDKDPFLSGSRPAYTCNYAQLTALLLMRLKNFRIIVLQKHDRKTHSYQAAGQLINVIMQYAQRYCSIAAVPIEEFSELHTLAKKHYWNLRCNWKQRCFGDREILILPTLKHTRRWHNWNTAHSQHSKALLWQLRNSHCAYFTHSPTDKKYCKQRQRCHDIWEILISQVEAECR